MSSYPARSTSSRVVTNIPHPNHPHSTFDLQHIARAMPLFLETGRSDIRSLPNEVLGEIFDHLLFLPHTEKRVAPAPICISHVSQHWRRVILEMASQWEVLRIRHTRCPDVLADLLARSRHHDLTLFIDLLKPMSVHKRCEFNKTLQAIVSHIPRVRTLSVKADNTTLHNLTQFLINVPMLNLQNLDLAQHGNMPYRFFGPLVFDPNEFTTLRLQRVMIECDASCLAGIHTLELHETSGTILNQYQLSFDTYPDIPNAPAMPQLTSLHIYGTSLILSNPHLLPSFSADSILSLELSNIHMTGSLSVLPIITLFNITLHPGLERLILHNIDLGSMHQFVQIIRAHSPKFPTLQSLTISHINLYALAGYIMPATPAISSLTLIDVVMNVEDVRETLRDIDSWPLIVTFNLNGIEYSRSY